MKGSEGPAALPQRGPAHPEPLEPGWVVPPLAPFAFLFLNYTVSGGLVHLQHLAT